MYAGPILDGGDRQMVRSTLIKDMHGDQGQYCFITEPLQSRLGQSSDADTQIQAILSEVLPAIQIACTSRLNVVQMQGNIPIRNEDCFGALEGFLSSSLLENGRGSQFSRNCRRL